MNIYREALQELVVALYDSGKVGYGDHPELEAALAKVEKVLHIENPCPEFWMEPPGSFSDKPEVWPCQLPVDHIKHGQLHQYVRTVKWSSSEDCES